MHFGVLTKHSEKARVFTKPLIEWLNRKGIKTLEVTPEKSLEGLNALVVVGGDGTLLYATRLLKGQKVPIIGINMGGLGFLTEIAPEEAFTAIDCFLSGQCHISERMMCKVEIFRKGNMLMKASVLNDVVVTKGNLARMIELETFVDSKYLSRYRSDGLIASTPTGSTAYVLSAGGPIITPEVDCIVLCPICPHTLTHRPIVLSADVVMDIVIKSESDVYLTLDGQEGYPLELDDRIVITKSDKKTYIVNSPIKSYFEILRAKLRWGER